MPILAGFLGLRAHVAVLDQLHPRLVRPGQLTSVVSAEMRASAARSWLVVAALCAESLRTLSMVE